MSDKIWRIFLIISHFSIITIVLFIERDFRYMELLGLIGVFSVFLGLLGYYKISSLNVFDPTGIYFLYLSISHLGLVIPFMISPKLISSISATHNMIWLSDINVVQSLRIIILFISSYLIMVLINSVKIISNNEEKSDKPNKIIVFSGFFLLIFTIIYFVFNLLISRIVFFDGYTPFRNSVGLLDEYPWILFIYGLGLLFVFARGTKNNIKIALILYGISASLLLVAGNRGEILYALASALGIYTLRFGSGKISKKMLFASLLIVFLLIPIIKNTRHTSFGEGSLSEISIDALEPIVEMGHQIRPLTYTVIWIASGQEFGKGITYWIPVQRQISLLVPFMDRIDITDYEGGLYDIKDRLPRQGYSVIAEAYINFGIVGTIVIPMIIAWPIIMLSKSRKLEILAGILFILINNIRNVFWFVPPQFIALLIIFYFLKLISNIKYMK